MDKIIYNLNGTFFFKYAWLCNGNINMLTVVGLMKTLFISIFMHSQFFNNGIILYVIKYFSLI